MTEYFLVILIVVILCIVILGQGGQVIRAQVAGIAIELAPSAGQSNTSNQEPQGPCELMNQDPLVFFDPVVNRYRNRRTGRFVANQCL